jgi:hypothetical protein
MDKRGLEGILGVLPVVEHASIHAENQRGVAPNEGRER